MALGTLLPSMLKRSSESKVARDSRADQGKDTYEAFDVKAIMEERARERYTVSRPSSRSGGCLTFERLQQSFRLINDHSRDFAGTSPKCLPLHNII